MTHTQREWGCGEGAERERRGSGEVYFPSSIFRGSSSLIHCSIWSFLHPSFYPIHFAFIFPSIPMMLLCMLLFLPSNSPATHPSIYRSLKIFISLSTISSTSSSSFSSFSPNLSSLFSLPSRPLLSSTLPCSISYPIPLHTNLFYYHPHSSSSCSLWSFTSCTNPPLLFLFVVLHLYPPPLHFPLPNPPSTSFSSCLFFPLTS